VTVTPTSIVLHPKEPTVKEIPAKTQNILLIVVSPFAVLLYVSSPLAENFRKSFGEFLTLRNRNEDALAKGMIKNSTLHC